MKSPLKWHNQPGRKKRTFRKSTFTVSVINSPKIAVNRRRNLKIRDATQINGETEMMS